MYFISSYAHSNSFRAGILLAALTALAAPPASGCACGCGIYEVGTSAMMPTGAVATASLDYDYQDQDRNWSGDHPAPAADNGDKDIRTDFLTLGWLQILDPAWALRIDLPYYDRHFVTTGGATGDQLVSLDFRGVGDIRLEGMYTGFWRDKSIGLIFGLKLPTGSFTTEDAYDDIDRDSQIGTGSTDVLLGGYYRFPLAAQWKGFAQVMLDAPLLIQDQYRPGAEFAASIGGYFEGFYFGPLRISPLAQIKLSARARDTGSEASQPVASGYRRILAAPGLEIDRHPWMFYADVELPLYQDFLGNQLAARALYRMNVSYQF